MNNNSASFVRGARVFQSDFFLLDQPLCSLWYKMYVCPRTHHQRQKRTGAGAIIARRKIIITYRTGTSGTVTARGIIPNCVRIFDSIGIIEPRMVGGGGGVSKDT